MKNLLVILGILVLLFEIYHSLRGNWIGRILEQKKRGERLRKPVVMRPKSELDCSYCVKEKEKRIIPRREMPVEWGERKGCGGPKKKTSTEGLYWLLRSSVRV